MFWLYCTYNLLDHLNWNTFFFSLIRNLWTLLFPLKVNCLEKKEGNLSNINMPVTYFCICFLLYYANTLDSGFIRNLQKHIMTTVQRQSKNREGLALVTTIYVTTKCSTPWTKDFHAVQSSILCRTSFGRLSDPLSTVFSVITCPFILPSFI